MTNANQKLVEDVGFIFSECASIQGLLRENFRSVSSDDVFFGIPKPSGGVQMPCGRAAAGRLCGLAEEAGRRSGLLRRVELDTIEQSLAELLVERFLRERRPVDQRQVQRALSAAGKAAKAKLVDTRYLIPCHLTLTRDPESLSLGPVTFHNRSSFRRLILPGARSYRSEGTEADRAVGRKLLWSALQYYRSFNWVAEVEIKRCDSATAANLAEQAITSALDCLQLLLGAQWTDRMRVGGPAVPADRRAQLAILSASDALLVSLSRRGAGQVNFTDGWSVHLEEPKRCLLLELCGIALEVAVDPDLERPLSRRFLEAARWFGEAVRDERPSTSVVKYVTALERMVMTDEREDITSLLSERVAVFCINMADGSDRQGWYEKARDTYRLRSQLVHGSMSPTATDAGAGARQAAGLAETTLLRCLSALGPSGLRLDSLASRDLAAWFAGLAKRADALSSQD